MILNSFQKCSIWTFFYTCVAMSSEGIRNTVDRLQTLLKCMFSQVDWLTGGPLCKPGPRVAATFVKLLAPLQGFSLIGTCFSQVKWKTELSWGGLSTSGRAFRACSLLPLGWVAKYHNTYHTQKLRDTHLIHITMKSRDNRRHYWSGEQREKDLN